MDAVLFYFSEVPNETSCQVCVPARPAALAIIGFVIGGIAGLFEPTFGFGWGGIFGLVVGVTLGKFVADMLTHAGI